MKTKNLWLGLLFPFLMSGLASCESQSTKRLPPPPPEVREVKTVRYRDLPPDCFEPVPVDVVDYGDDNELVAKGYRTNLKVLQFVNRRSDRCRAMNGAPLETSPEASH